jgi:hypothetical protein
LFYEQPIHILFIRLISLSQINEAKSSSSAMETYMNSYGKPTVLIFCAL